MTPSDDRISINEGLVRHLVDTQFPEWADLPIRPVDLDGWDNSTFRLGDRLKVRLPTASRYADQPEREFRWLPYLAERLPVRVPEPLALGTPDTRYPYPWSIYRWIDGDPCSADNIADDSSFAVALAGFLVAMHQMPTAGAPASGPHNFYRGGSLAVYDAETRQCLTFLKHEIDSVQALAVWETAVSTTWNKPDVWIHGDFASGNLLVREGKLSAVIDFGTCCVGDPACDLVIAWTFLTGVARKRFRAALAIDDATWARARGWALWKALLTLTGGSKDRSALDAARRVIAAVQQEHARGEPKSGNVRPPR